MVNKRRPKIDPWDTPQERGGITEHDRERSS